MPPKALVITLLTVATTLGTLGDVSIGNIDLQLITKGQLQKIVNQLIDNNRILNKKLNSIRAVKVKLLLIKQFLEERLKLKGFLT